MSRDLQSEQKSTIEEFKTAASKWMQSQENYETEIKRLNEMYRSDLGKIQKDLVLERKQSENYGLCADNLTGELEQFRDRQEKMEFLISHLKVERERSDRHVTSLRQVIFDYHINMIN